MVSDKFNGFQRMADEVFPSASFMTSFLVPICFSLHFFFFYFSQTNGVSAEYVNLKKFFDLVIYHSMKSFASKLFKLFPLPSPLPNFLNFFQVLFKIFYDLSHLIFLLFFQFQIYYQLTKKNYNSFRYEQHNLIYFSDFFESNFSGFIKNAFKYFFAFFFIFLEGFEID